MIKKIFNLLEYIFGVSSLILYTGGIITVMVTDGLSEGEIDFNQVANDSDRFFIVKILYPITYIVALFLLTTNLSEKFTKVSKILSQNIHILLVIGFAVLSIVWSELPSMTASRSGALVGTSIFGIYLANRYSLAQQLSLLGHTFLGIIFLSIIFALVLPQYGVMGGIHSGAWRGIYSHKNEFGRLMSLSAIIFVMQSIGGVGMATMKFRTRSIGGITQNLPMEFARSKLLETLLIYLGLSLSILLLALSKSSGAVVNLIVMIISLIIFKIAQLSSHQRFLMILGTIVSGCIFAIIVVPDPESLFASFGKSSDLTGRGDLWSVLIDLLWKSPLLGFGYGAFWEKYGPTVALAAGWNAPDAHNGFLDLTLSIGLLGLALFIISYCYSFLRGLAKFRSSPGDIEIYPLILLVYIVVGNISETGLFTSNNLTWLLYVTISCSVTMQREKTILYLPKSRSI